MPMLSTTIVLLGIERVGRLDRAADHHRAEAVELGQLVLPADQRLELLLVAPVSQAVDVVLGDHTNSARLMAYTPSRRIGPLAAALAARRLLVGADRSPTRNAAGVLEVVAGDDAAQRLARRQRLAVAGVDVADLALRNRHQRHLMDAVLPAPEAEMQAAAQQLGLEAGLAVQGDDAAFGHRALARPQLLDDADAVVGDVPQAHRFPQQQQANGQQQHEAD